MDSVTKAWSRIWKQSVWRKDGILLSLRHYLCPLKHLHGCNHLGKPWPWRLSGEEKILPEGGHALGEWTAVWSQLEFISSGDRYRSPSGFYSNSAATHMTWGWVFIQAHSAHGEWTPVGMMLAAEPDQMKLPFFCLNSSQPLAVSS